MYYRSNYISQVPSRRDASLGKLTHNLVSQRRFKIKLEEVK